MPDCGEGRDRLLGPQRPAPTGYATEAVRALTLAAFEHLRASDAVEIHMDRANVASAGVPAKLGYRPVGEEDRPVLTPGHTGRGLV